MARRIKNQKSDETLINLIDVKDQAQNFFDRNQKYILGIAGAFLVVVGGYWGYKHFIIEPRQQEAEEQMFQAEVQFERDSFALALTNPGGGYSGFLDIIDNYKGTKAANLAGYYAGICYLNLGQYDAAIDYLKSYNAKGDVTPAMKNGALGDAYSEKNDFEQALSYYAKAVSAADNEAITPYYLKKLGMLQEKQGKFSDAKASYERIKREYPNSPIATDIEKYIIRAGAKG